MANNSLTRFSSSGSGSSFPAALLLLVLMSIMIQFPVTTHGRSIPAALMNPGVKVQEQQGGAFNAATLSNEGSPVQSQANNAADGSGVDGEDETVTTVAVQNPSINQDEAQLNDYLPLEQVFSLERRSLNGPGSSPPQCTSKCGRCYPCKPVHVPIQPGLVKTAEYYPEAWRCKCGNKLFMP